MPNKTKKNPLLYNKYIVMTSTRKQNKPIKKTIQYPIQETKTVVYPPTTYE